MKLNKDTVLSTVLGLILAAACNGRLIVADGTGRVAPGDGGVATGGVSSAGGASAGGGSAILESGGRSNGGGGTGVGGTSAGGASGAGSGGVEQGGAGGEVIVGTGGHGTPVTCSEVGGASGFTGAGGNPAANTPTCSVDANGIAASDFATLCTGYRCPASSAILLKGLTCDEPTTDHAGFTKTVGCGVETIEFNAEGGQAVYQASFDLTTTKLTALKVREDHPTCMQVCPCTAFGFQAGPAPSVCPTAVTYRCHHAVLVGPDESQYSGCRDPGEAKCAECCEGSRNPDYCQLWSSGHASIYDVERGAQGLCPCGCEPCAACKLEDERQARISVERPECDCSKVVVPPTGAGGADPGGDSCIPYCSYRNSLSARCPGF